MSFCQYVLPVIQQQHTLMIVIYNCIYYLISSQCRTWRWKQEMQVVTVRLIALLLMWVSETSAEGKCQAIEMVSDHFPSGVIQHSLLSTFNFNILHFLLPIIWNWNTFTWLTLHRMCKSKSYVAVMNLSLPLRSLWNSFTSAVCFTNIKEWKGQLNNFMQFGGKNTPQTNYTNAILSGWHWSNWMAFIFCVSLWLLS